MQWIDTNDLQLWASKPTSKAGLPELISRLIRSTVSDLKDVRIPKGSQTFRGGWDGVVHSNIETEFVPEGVSVWEFGTESGIKGKAEKDYNKRTADPLGEDPATSTFVFVTPRVWEGKDEWVKEKLKEGKWKDVKVYDAEKFVEWLSIAPVQNELFARGIGRATSEGLLSPNDFWSDWSIGRDYTLSPEIITAGRQDTVSELQKKLDGPPSIIAIQAASRDEAIAFVIGAAKQFDAEQQENFFARSLIVEQQAAFRQISSNYSGLFLIAKFESSGGFYSAISNKHFVIVPMGADESDLSQEPIKLPKLGREDFIDALQGIGISREKAEILSKETGRNITVLRRREAFGSTVVPEWAKPEHVRVLIPALLLGKWDEKKPGDKELLMQLSGDNYDNYIAELTQWKNVPDAPIYQIGSKWRLASPLDMWAYLAKFLTAADIDLLRSAFTNATKQVKPKYDLDADKRHLASLYGKEFSYSRWAREGLSQAITLLALFGARFNSTLTNPQRWVDSVVSEVLHDISENLWNSAAEILPLLAEASPAAFMDAIERSLSSKEATVLGLFKEEESLFFPTSHHSNLLWALEGIAWLPEYLSRAALILAKLALNDPGGRVSNRPINSLRSIFLPWNPQTLSSISIRMQVLKRMSQVVPAIAWELGIKLLPKGQEINSPTHAFRWRLVGKGNATTVYMHELFDNYSQVLDMLLSFAGNDIQHIVDLLEALPNLQPRERDKIVNHVKAQIDGIVDNGQLVRNACRILLHHHRSYPDAPWALPEAELIPIQEFYDKLTPTSIIDAYTWMFADHWIQFPEGNDEHKGHEEQTRLIAERRRSALQVIQSQIGIDGVVDLASIYAPWILGETLAYIIDSEEQFSKVFKLLNADDERKQQALQAFVFRAFWIKGLPWIINLYKHLEEDKQSHTTLSKVVISIPNSAELYAFLEGVDEKVSNEYWHQFRPWLNGLAVEDQITTYQKLLQFKRFPTAFDLAYHIEEIPSSLLVELLEKAATEPSSEHKQTGSYNITHLFGVLEKRGNVSEDELAKLELLYLSTLCGVGSGRKPQHLFKELSDNPESFITVLKWTYKSRLDEINIKEHSMVSEEDIQNRAHAGWALLHAWKRIPGTDNEGRIDFDLLNKWISEVRIQADEIGRLDVADAEIGKVLAQYTDSDPNWPSDGICQIIDSLNSDSLSRNFQSGIFNRYGSTTRGVFEGGTIERTRSSHFAELAKKHAAAWPVTSSILDNLASQYDSMAKEQDHQAQQDESEY